MFCRSLFVLLAIVFSVLRFTASDYPSFLLLDRARIHVPLHHQCGFSDNKLFISSSSCTRSVWYIMDIKYTSNSYRCITMLSVLRYTDSDYPFGILKLFSKHRGLTACVVRPYMDLDMYLPQIDLLCVLQL
jgi:hypothetical protein